ncbi:hypothetical protein GMORB2_3934 [Geosmithia morbida]|uniref:DNA ligase D 3'-phosphoesterase domain-containing protein n=1 Tax=Geosmithia morbida TaxID=1094350 RepID=A0A9P4YZU5_9HYPO|nr:uncharacterized protein GMORB2_3934 [Geosmithia morbida]KAF4125095.1 hypothetical protein GMORB2_3934 [Geosmithia morbida]
MNEKRPLSPDLVANPFIKKRNLNWTISPPATNKLDHQDGDADDDDEASEDHDNDDNPTTAAIEAGHSSITDHPSLFSNVLKRHTLPSAPILLPVQSCVDLYRSCINSPQGAHFVIHQHDHPVAGTHYDLRLQINPSSSVSWAVMYGLPGDPNSSRLNRNATETRIHCLWQTLLHEAFQQRKIRVRLHGSRLPDPYVLNLRLTKKEDAAGRSRRPAARRRGKPTSPEETSDNENGAEEDGAIVPNSHGNNEALSAMEREMRELEDQEVRQTNAYPGATNTIGSVHQRKWYLSLDRVACGLIEGRDKVWRRRSGDATASDGHGHEDAHGERLTYPFYVRGADHERSVVTARKGENVLFDEGVVGFIRRRGWKPILS